MTIQPPPYKWSYDPKSVAILTALLVAALSAFSAFVATIAPSQPSKPSKPSNTSEQSGTISAGQLSRLPLAFEPNAERLSPSIQFTARSARGAFAFSHEGVQVYISSPSASSAAKHALGPDAPAPDAPAVEREDTPAQEPPAVLKLAFVGADPSPQLVSDSPLPGHVNYFLGNNPQRWRTDLPLYSSLTYRDLYPGIDLVYSGDGANLKGTYRVAPRADPSLIAWSYGGSSLSLDPEGNLLIASAQDVTSAGLPEVLLTEQAPVAWQNIDGQRVSVEAGYSIAADGVARFTLGRYDTSIALEIDPTLVYASFLGGSDVDLAYNVTLDAAGYMYLIGLTLSDDFPVASPLQPVSGGTYDMFVTKLNPQGSALVFSTYIGGSGEDKGYSIAVDGSGNVAVTGTTTSSDFPLANAIQSMNHGAIDVAVAKLNASGSALVFSTYLGGTAADNVYSIAIDTSGSVIVAGTTLSGDYPTHNPIQPTKAGSYDAFVTKLTSSGTAFVYSTFLGGSQPDFFFAITVDSADDVVAAGSSASTDYPLVNAYQTTNHGSHDVVITVFNPSGSALLYSTYLGGSNLDFALDIELDSAGNIYIGGDTASFDYPTVSPFQPSFSGGYDAILAKFNPSGSALLYSTFLGGTEEDDGFGLAVGPSGLAYVAGLTFSANFPQVDPIGSFHNGQNIFLSALDTNSSSALYSTYLGAGYAVGVVSNHIDRAVVVGTTSDPTFHTVNPVQQYYGGGITDAFISVVANLQSGSPTPTPTVTPVPQCSLAWRIFPTPGDGTIRALDALSSNDVWAAGFTGNGSIDPHQLVLHWDGSTWTSTPLTESDGHLEAISAISSSDIWAAGYTLDSGTLEEKTLVLHWDGTAWARVPSPNPATLQNELQSLDILSPTDIWAFGAIREDEDDSFHTLAMHWNGTGWTVVPTPDPFDGVLLASAAISPDDIWAAGSYFIHGEGRRNLTIHWDGTAWTGVDSTITTISSEINGIAALAANDVWAVGNTKVSSTPLIFHTMVLHWNGAAWSEVPTPNPPLSLDNGLFGVAAISANDIWAVGHMDDSTLILRWDGSAWSKVPSPNLGYSAANALNAISFVSPADIWAGGVYNSPTRLPIIERYSDPCATPTRTHTTTPAATLVVTHTPTATSIPTSIPTRTRTAIASATRAVTHTPTVTSIPTSSPTACPITFSDVEPQSTFYDYITYLACGGVVTGYADGTFRPANNTTRGQVSKIVTLAEGWTIDTSGGPHFSDVLATNTFYVYIETAYHHGVLSGYADGTFRWGNDVTRGQLSKIIVLAEQWKINLAGAPHFNDVNRSSTFYDYIETAYNRSIISGYLDGTFRPGNSATRGQVSKMVYLAVTSP